MKAHPLKKLPSLIRSSARCAILGALAIFLLPVASLATWVPTTGGTYSYSALANWSGGVIDNVFLPSTYAGGAQTITLSSDGVWNSTTGVTTSSTNNSTLLLISDATSGSNRNLGLGGDINYAMTGSSTSVPAVNILQFGTVTANQDINFSLSTSESISVSSAYSGSAAVVFNGVLSGAGGLVKNGNGSLYLQNAAETFTGALTLNGGYTYLNNATGTLATQSITIGRLDSQWDNFTNRGAVASLILGNGLNTVGTSSGSAGQNSNRISDTATVTMKGGSLQLINAVGGSVTETLGTVTLSRGVNSLNVSPVSTTSATLAIGNLVRSAGVTLFAVATDEGSNVRSAFGTGIANEGRITISTINGADPSTAVVNGIIPWAVNSSFASSQYHDLSGGDFLTFGAYGLTPVTTFSSDVTTATATDNVKLASGAAGSSSTITINSLTTTNGWTVGASGAGKVILTAGALNLRTSNANGGVSYFQSKLDFNNQEANIFIQGGDYILYYGMANANGLTVTGIGSNNKGYYTGGVTSLAFNPVGGQLAVSYTGPTTINNAVLDIGWNSYIPVTSAVTINEGGGLAILGASNNQTIASLSGYGTVYGSRLNDAATQAKTLTIGDSTSTVFAGQIVKGGAATTFSITKAGTGTLAFSGANTYTGTTTVSTGTLLINGNQSAATGAVTVSGVATLGGSGTIGGAVSISSGGVLSPGNNAIGNLTAASLALSSGAISNFEIGGTTAGTFDTITTTGGDGSITLNGTLNLIFSVSLANNSPLRLFIGPSSNIGDFTAITLTGSGYSGTFTSHVGTLWTSTQGAQTLTLDASTGVLGASPEPSTVAMVLLAGLLGLVCSRRRARGSQSASLRL